MIFRFFRFTFLAAVLLVLQACQPDTETDAGSGPASDQSATDQFVTINGVSSKGPISGATVEVMQFDSNGSETSTILATTTTDSSGDWQVSIPAASHTQALLIKSSGGMFLDESDPNPNVNQKRRIALASNEYLLGVLFPGYNTASVTMITHALIEKARTESASSGDFFNVLANNRAIASAGLGFDPFTVTATNPLTPSASASTDSIEYAMYLGGLATALNSAAIELGIPLPGYSMINGMIADLSDGDLDGANQNGPVMLDVGNGSVAFPSDIDLNNAITRFRNNNFAAYSVTPVSQVVSVNESAMTISGVNTAPVAFDDSFATVTNASIITGNVLSNDSDPDGDTLTISSVTQPANGQVVNNGNGTFNFTPASSFSGNAVFSYTISDGHGGSDSAQVIVVVSAAPAGGGSTSPPVADAGIDQSVNEGTTVNLAGSGSDSDGSISAYLWSQLNTGNTVSITNANSANASFTAPSVAAGQSTTLIFELQVTDNDGLKDTDIVTVVVNSTQTAGSIPVANAGPDQTVNEQSSVSLDATASTDDGSIVAYSWTQTSGSPQITLTNANTATPSFIGPNIASDTTFTFFVIVTDDANNSATDSVNINMIADVGIPNENPVANTDNVSTVQGIPLNSINVLSNDTDPDTNPVILIGVTQPSNGSAVNNGDGTVSYTPNLSFNGSDSFTYSVVDGQGGSATGSVIVTVDADSDGDGLLDSYETNVGLDPNDPDFDNDGYYDGHEMLISGTAAFLSNETPAGTVIDTSNNVISASATWSLAASPYWVQSNVSVQGGAVLTIEAGVVVKFDPGTSINVAGDADLKILGNSPVPQNVRFTSITDDSLNGDTGSVVGTPAAGNWAGVNFQASSRGDINNLSVRYASSCISANDASPALKHVEVGDCSNYGIYIAGSTTSITSYLRDINVVDFDNNGTSTGYSSLYIQASSAITNTLDIANVSIDKPGNGNYGVWLYAYSNANITGVIDQLSVTNAGYYPLYITNAGSGNVDPTLSNISILAPTNNSYPYLYVNNTGSGTLTPKFDGSNTISGSGGTSNAAIRVDNASPEFLASGSWTLSNVGYGLMLNNATGQYNNITMDTINTAGLQLSNASNPTVFSNIVLTNSPSSPYELVGQNLTATITAGYDYSAASVAKNYVRIGGSLLSDMVLTPDPLGTGNSVWLAFTSITVPNGISLNIDDGAIVKFALNQTLTVNGTLQIGDGIAGGAQSVLTSFRDDAVGAAISDGTAAAWNDWNYISIGDNSVIMIDNAIIRYADRAIYQYYSQPQSVNITNTDISDIYYHGLEIDANTGDNATWNLDNVTLNRVGVNSGLHGIYVYTTNDSTVTGNWNNLTLNNIGGSGIYFDDNSTGVVNPAISGLTIGDAGTVGGNGVTIIGGSSTTPVFNNSSGTGNSITGGLYNLSLQGVAGSYSNLHLTGAADSSIYLSAAANPTTWDDASIVLDSSPSPYRILTDFPASIGTFGTTDLGYAASSTVTQNYVTTGGTLSNTTYVADPLNTGNSQYLVATSITVPALTTLTIEDGAILKFALNQTLTVNGTLQIGDGITGGSQSVLTSFRDDTVGAAISDGTAAAWNDWNYIYIGDNSVINIDNAIIRYADRAIYQYYSQPLSVDITNTEISDIYYYGIEIDSNTGDNVTWNLDGITFDRVGVNTSYHGIYIYANNDAIVTGTWGNLTLNNIGGSGIYIDDNSTGTINPTINNLTIGDTGTVGGNGISMYGDSSTAVNITNSAISGATYNLYLDGVAGTYNNLSLDGASIAAIYFSNGAAPSSWNSVSINNAPTPYHLVAMNIPSGVSYTTTSGLSENYIRLTGPISSDLILLPDPLGTAAGSGLATDATVSYWYVPSTLQIDATLNIEQDALFKFDEGVYLQVNAGGVLNINGSAGHEVYLTSFSDNQVGNPATSAAVPNDWYGIRFQTNSNGGNISYLQSWYSYYGVYFGNMAVDASFIDISINYPLYGLYFSASTAIAPGFNNISIDQASNQGIYFASSGAINPSFNGSKTITGSSTDCIYNNSSSPNILISGWTLDGCGNGIDIHQAGTYVNNLIRNSSGSGIYVSTASAITIGNNRIVNNGAPVANGGGIDVRAIGATSVIENNLIRHNRAQYGGGMYFNGGVIDASVRNNLILENQGTIDVGGIYVYDNSTLQLSNNTVAGNSVAQAADVGAGLFIQDLSNNVSYHDNIFYNNRDTDSLENINDLSAGSVENFNLEDGNSGNGLSGANSLTSTDPLFVQGWYLAANSPAIDAGSDLSANLGLTGTTTQADGVVDNNQVDLGYHYTAAATSVSATTSTLTPTSVNVAFSTKTTFVLTPRDSLSNIIGAGLNIQVSAGNFPNNVGRTIDLGDGTYQIEYTSGTVTGSDVLSFIVNGVTISTQALIGW